MRLPREGFKQEVRETMVAFALAGACTTAALWLGGVTDASVAAVAPFVVLAWALALPWKPRRRGARLISIALWMLVAIGLLQLLPLPAPLLRLLSPRGFALWQANDQMSVGGARWHPLTLDLHATAFKSATTAICAAFFEAASRLATRSSAARDKLRAALLASVILAALAAAAHAATGATMLYGVWATRKPFNGPIPLPSTFVNPNHAAAAFAIIPPLAIGIGLRNGTLLVRLTSFLGAALGGAFVILTLSRSGMAVLAAELLTIAGLSLLFREDGGRTRVGAALAVLGVAAGAACIATFVALESAVREATDTSTGKFALIARAAEMSRDYVATGVGRGAFISTFSQYEGELRGAIDVAGRVRFTHPESWPIQLLVDVGAPAACIVVGLFVFGTVAGARACLRRPAQAGALVAAAGLAVHDLADFALDFAGVGLLGVGLLALITSAERPTSSRGMRPGVWLLVRAALALGSTFVLTRHWQHDVDDDASRLAERWRRDDLANASAELDAAMSRHPAEPYFHIVSAAREFRTAHAGQHLVRAVVLGPWRAQSHYWLARWLEVMERRGQAWAEYHEAVRLNPALATWVLADLVRVRAPIFEMEAVDATEAEFDQISNALVRDGRSADADELDSWLIGRFSLATEARFRRILRLRDSGRRVEATAASKRFLEVAPHTARAYQAAAALETDAAAAEAWLVRGIEVLHDDPDLLEDLIRRRGSRAGLEVVAPELERLRAVAAMRYGSPARVDELMGDIESAQGHYARAVTHYVDAAAASGTDGGGYLEKAASAAEELGDLALAERLWRRAAAARPEERWIQERATRAAAARSAVPSHVPPPSPP